MAQRSKSTAKVTRGLLGGPGCIAVAALTVAGMLSACGIQSESAPASDEAKTSLTIATPYAVNDLDPFLSGYWAPEFGYGEMLMRAKEDGTIEPWLLESLESAEPTKWILTLRDGIAFQNGTTLDAKMLADLLNYLLKKSPDLAAVIPGGKASAVSDLVVELTTEKPAGAVPAAFAHELLTPIFDFRAVQKAGDDVDAQIEAQYWTGPFVVTEITSEHMELEADEDYWGGDTQLEDVTLLFVPDEQARLLSVQSNQANIALYPDAASARTLEGRDDGFFVTSDVSHSSVRMILNLEDKALADQRVREAVSHAVDFAELGEKVLPAVFDTAVGMFPGHLPFTVDTQSTNLDEAKSLLDEAGWATGSGDFRQKDGQQLTLTFIMSKEIKDLQALAVAMQAQLRKVGIEVKIREVDDIYETTDEDPWSATFLMSNVFGHAYVGEAQRFLHSEGARNLGHINDPELDALIDEALHEVDEEDQGDLLEQIQELVAEKTYSIFPAERRTSIIAGAGWQDYNVTFNNLWINANTGTVD